MNKYVKVIDTENNIIDALNVLHFVKWDSRANMVINCKDTDKNRMGLLSYDASTIWHINNTSNFPSERGYTTVNYVDINKDEFDALRKALDNGKIIESEPESKPVEDESSVSFLKTAKITEMSKTCEEIITKGIDVVVSNGETRHFSLTVQDQLNLITLSKMVEAGEEYISYHADGELCTFYSAQDIQAIITTATAFKTYHTTYFNSLKAYIKSLRSVNSITNVVYGMDIPEKYQSDVWKEINKNDKS